MTKTYQELQMSVKDKIEYGLLMVNTRKKKKRWKVEFVPERNTALSDSLYVWTSPRGEKFYSMISNVPPEVAIDNALRNKDIKELVAG